MFRKWQKRWPRKPIRDFAEAMEAEMRANQWVKGSTWKSLDLDEIEDEILDHFNKWIRSRSKEHAADLGNAAMMAWRLSEDPPEPDTPTPIEDDYDVGWEYG